MKEFNLVYFKMEDGIELYLREGHTVQSELQAEPFDDKALPDALKAMEAIVVTHNWKGSVLSKKAKRCGCLREMDLWAQRVAAFVYSTAVLETSDCNWIVDEDEINDQFGDALPKGWAKDKAFLNFIKEDLFEYPGINGGQRDSVDDDQVQIYREDGALRFDITLFTDYAATTNTDEDENM